MTHRILGRRRPLSLPRYGEVNGGTQRGANSHDAVQQGLKRVRQTRVFAGAATVKLSSQFPDRRIEAGSQRTDIASPTSAVKRIGDGIQGVGGHARTELQRGGYRRVFGRELCAGAAESDQLHIGAIGLVDEGAKRL